MRAVLMAGGSGTRLRPLTCDMPKPMVSVLNRPITEHILNLLKRHGIREVIATLHYLPDVIREHFGDGSDFGVNMMYVVEEDQPLGTAGCVKNVESLLDLNLYHQLFDFSLPYHGSMHIFWKEDSKLSVCQLKKHIRLVGKKQNILFCVVWLTFRLAVLAGFPAKGFNTLYAKLDINVGIVALKLCSRFLSRHSCFV